jgi:ABC-2 type transport system permease protein
MVSRNSKSASEATGLESSNSKSASEATGFDLRLVLTQARYALLLSFRDPRAVVFGIAFPIVLLVMFNAIFTSGSSDTVHFAGGTISGHAYFTAGIAAYAIGLSTFTTLVVGLTTQRETGQLKRLRGTPMPPWTFLAAQVLRSVVRGLMTVVALFAIGAIAFGVHLSAERLVGLVAYVALATAVFTTLGMAVTALTPTAEAASAVGPFAVVILSFISGAFIPVDQIPNWLESVGKVFPLYHLADGLQTSLVAGGGTGLATGDVVALAVWGLAGLLIAKRHFRWEPQAARA